MWIMCLIPILCKVQDENMIPIKNITIIFFILPALEDSNPIQCSLAPHAVTRHALSSVRIFVLSAGFEPDNIWFSAIFHSPGKFKFQKAYIFYKDKDTKK